MIDLGLSKLAIIGVVALMVIGPEKLPKVARMAGSLYGRAQRYLNDVKAEVSREIELDELKNLHKEVQEAAQSIKDGVENSIAQNMAEVEHAWRDDVPLPLATTDDLARKAREFRRKKLLRSSAVPVWYKQRHGGKMHVISGAARVAKFRPAGKSQGSFY
ncbi:Sec-independent protein translocase protein TatB [Janthinobacterium sp.]|uniref:Sec-independent protein translocase protein TatB n=1 Tax=Janthinobacterium sp. TaxID=1871054 RepID=UPI00293D79F5|nr:Sec-independent protein translocase protein TatB [Janthinobacterium sp.]